MGLVLGGALALAASEAQRRWRRRGRRRPGGAAAAEVAALQGQVSLLHEQLREGRVAWKEQEMRLQEELRGHTESLRGVLLASNSSAKELAAQPACAAKAAQANAGGALGTAAGQLVRLGAFELQLSFKDRDKLVELVLDQQPALAQLDVEELLQRLALYDARGPLLPPAWRGALRTDEAAHPMRVRYAEPRVHTANPRLRGVRVGDLLDFFEAKCGDVAYEEAESFMQPLCMATKLARLCNQRNIHAAQLGTGARCFREMQPNMYAVEALLLRPLTEPERLSAAEVWCPEGVTIDIFVSHFWGQDFGEFVQSTYRFVLRHFRDLFPKLAQAAMLEHVRQTGLYVCAFSNNQWNLKCEMGSRVEDSPFYKVLKADTTTTVAMNLDQMAACLLRAWCSFEFYYSHVLKKNLVLNCRYGPLRRLGCCSSSDGGKVAELWMLHVFELLQEVDIRLATSTKKEDMAMIQAEISSFEGMGVAAGLTGADALNRLLKSMIASEVLPVLARLGNLPALDQALANGADVEAVDHRHIRPLTYAAAAHGPDSPVAQLLLRHGADPAALAHATVIVELFSEDSSARKSALAQINKLLSSAERKFHRATLRLAREQHLARYASLLRALAQVDEKASALETQRFGVDTGVSTPSDRPASPGSRSGGASPVPDWTVSVVQEAASRLAQRGPEGETPKTPRALRSDWTVPVAQQSTDRLSHTGSPGAKSPGNAMSWKSSQTPQAAHVHSGSSRLLIPPLRAVKTSSRTSTLGSHQLQGPRSATASVGTNTPSQLNVPVILEHLEHDDSGLRLAACEVLGDLGKEAAEHAPQLVERLQDQDEAVRVVALNALARVGASALEPEHMTTVAELLEDESGEVREAACDTLASLGARPELPLAASAPLAAALADPDEDVRCAAVGALTALGPEVATQHAAAIAQCLASEEPETLQVAALDALGQLGEGATPLLPTIAECLEHRDWRVREAACGALAQVGETAAVHAPELASLLEDSDSDVRGAACAALAQLGDAAAAHAPEIAGCLADGDAEVRGIAVAALAQLGEVATHASQIVDCLADQSVDVRRSACEALGHVGVAAATDALSSCLQDPACGVQEAAAEALAGIAAASSSCKPSDNPEPPGSPRGGRSRDRRAQSS